MNSTLGSVVPLAMFLFGFEQAGNILGVPSLLSLPTSRSRATSSSHSKAWSSSVSCRKEEFGFSERYKLSCNIQGAANSFETKEAHLSPSRACFFFLLPEEEVPPWMAAPIAKRKEKAADQVRGKRGKSGHEEELLVRGEVGVYKKSRALVLHYRCSHCPGSQNIYSSNN